MSDNVLFFVFSFLVCFFTIAALKPVAYKIGLVDQPNARKVHSGHVPLIGGIGIFVGIILSSVTFLEVDALLIFYLVSAGILLILGVFDDKFDLPVRVRIAVQLLIGIIMSYYFEIQLISFGYIFGSWELTLGVMSPVITIIAVIGAINAFNMVDGIDGLAGTLSLVSFAFLAILLFSTGSVWWKIAFSFIPAILAFLVFNLKWPIKGVKKVFLGDAGSMVIGFTIVWLLVKGTTGNEAALKPVTGLYIIALPLMDMVAIMFRRIKKGASPFKPDREHLHHICERAGYTRKQSLCGISIIALVIASLGVCMQLANTPEWFMFALFIAMFLIYNYAIIHIWRLLSWVRKHRPRSQ